MLSSASGASQGYDSLLKHIQNFCVEIKVFYRKSKISKFIFCKDNYKNPEIRDR